MKQNTMKPLKTQRSKLRLSERRGKTCFDFAEREQLHCEAITRTSAEMRERTEVRDRVSSDVQRRDLRNLEVSIHFSIIVPVYNRPDEVDELLDSLCKQSDKDFEVVIVEDGSSVRCEDVCRKYGFHTSTRKIPDPAGVATMAQITLQEIIL